MKTRTIILVALSLYISFILHHVYGQISITGGPEVTPEEMVAFFIGPGISYTDVFFQGVPSSRGVFTNGSSTNIGLEEGIFLTSGTGLFIPGPNTSCSSGQNNSSSGHPWLTAICQAGSTYDAAVLQFDFIPMNDTVRCWYVFGSEEYNEWVASSFNDVFGFFVTGPNPAGGNYMQENIAIVPGTGNTPVAINNVNNGFAPCGVIPAGPCQNCEFFVDNTGGMTIQYDAFTVALPAWILVVPGEEYNFTFGVADAADGIYDSGVLLEGASFKSPGPPDFFAFNLLAEHNPQLSFDVTGEIEGHTVTLDLPQGTDPTSLVASFEEHGADVFVNGVRQESGVTVNDFSEPLIYHLVGYESAEWYVIADELTAVSPKAFKKVRLVTGSVSGKLEIKNLSGISVKIFDMLGHPQYESNGSEDAVLLDHLAQGLYIVWLEKDGLIQVRKILI